MSSTGSRSPVLHSGPLELRPYTEADEQVFVDLFQDPEVVRYVGDGLQTEEADRAVFHRVFSEVYPLNKFAVWAVLANGSVVGHAELKPSPNDDIDGWELVYVIGRSHWRRGYGRLVASLVIRYGFDELGLPMVFATVDLENTASLALLKGLGFAQVGETVDNGQRIAVLSIQAPE